MRTLEFLFTRDRCLGLVLLAASAFALDASAADLRVLPTGLGDGTVTSSVGGINCSSAMGGICDASFGSTDSVVLTATPAAGSVFAGWSVEAEAASGTSPDCTGTGTCSLTMSSFRSARPHFNPSTAIPTLTAADPTAITPAEIQAFLTANPSVDTPAEFLAALPASYREAPILMTRSESLQTGTAEFPRILLFSSNAKSVFSFGVLQHSSYPGSHPLAVEYMQFDSGQKNFRFHEIVLGTIPAMGAFGSRSRGVAVDDQKCSSCHSTRNVINPTGFPGTDGDPPGSIVVKNKPNWDPYDSWAGMLPFNRDRIYKGSLEAAAFRRLMNPWTWRDAPAIRAVIEQLRLQPVATPAAQKVTRALGGALDGTPRFPFDPVTPPAVEPAPIGSAADIFVNYAFDGLAGSGTATLVERQGDFVTLLHPSQPAGDEGRGVQLFDLLNGFDGERLNPMRIADELANHRWATGSVPVDARPLALGILNGCLTRSGGSVLLGGAALPAATASFFLGRNGGKTAADVFNDTTLRTQSIPRRKADLQKRNLERTGDIYVDSVAPADPAAGLIAEYGVGTSQGTDASLARLRQEVFRRPVDLGGPDATVMGGIYVDRELYSNTEKVALFRYLLEPLGVSVDKWSLGVRGRSRSYAFADVFSEYTGELTSVLQASLGISSCGDLTPAINAAFAALPPTNDVPTYTDIQRIFNKACIECHGGLEYPPYANYGSGFDLSEDHTGAYDPEPMRRSYDTASPAATYILDRITRTSEACPGGVMPCEGPPLSEVDVETIRRWINGSTPYSWGDPHLQTVTGERYDFQSAGEFVLLKDLGMELQARFMPVQTEHPVGPDPHTGLSMCASITTAIAVRVGDNKVTYQMPVENRDGRMELRINGKLVQEWGGQLLLSGGGRVVRTPAMDGIQIESAGGTLIRITPHWWAHYQVWYLDLHLERARATQGVLGKVSPGNWLPALPDGSLFGPRPADPYDRYAQLYEKFDDAWRVDDKTTLFDYPAGWSTRDFTLEEWPHFKAEQCRVESPPPGIPVMEPLDPIPFEKAWEICGQLEDKEHRRICAQDVAATGDPVFAEGYLVTLEVERNEAPEAVPLVFPEDFGTIGSKAVFEWKATFDKNDDPVTYRFCLWHVSDRFSLARCESEPSTELSRSAYLKEGQSYFWKVLAEDGKGGASESQTRRVTAK